MILDFYDKEAALIWSGAVSRKLPAAIRQLARRRLRMLNSATTLEDLLLPPGNRFEILKGDRKGQYSIRINQQWRICFSWVDGDCARVEIVDYH